MLAIVCLRPWVSTSSRYCADSACAGSRRASGRRRRGRRVRAAPGPPAAGRSPAWSRAASAVTWDSARLPGAVGEPQGEASQPRDAEHRHAEHRGGDLPAVAQPRRLLDQRPEAGLVECRVEDVRIDVEDTDDRGRGIDRALAQTVAVLPQRAVPNATAPMASSTISSWVPVITWRRRAPRPGRAPRPAGAGTARPPWPP